ncbi:TIGR02444 family protein [Hyphomicrobium sp. MC1]|uniref:TIGR02444 family protein n=1 Tax=Hyphomicrobium sp. (strain MC1) TaxID=717785 RepID=UPI000213E919|nr:TIGR02444 family protein [Hyphomicrobium sp. MC1]CCB66581.1 protein of unknown function [Hyphomicrobium sp. MC1]
MTTDPVDGGPAIDLWNFSLDVYAATGVAEECLTLQDSYRLDVNLILMAAFAGVKGRNIPQSHLDDASRCTADWYANVICGLRGVRRATKGLIANCSNPQEWETLRRSLKDIELKAEKEEQATLANWMQAHSASWPTAPAREAVVTNLGSLFNFYGMDDNDPNRVSYHLIVACEKFIAAREPSTARGCCGS